MSNSSACHWVRHSVAVVVSLGILLSLCVSTTPALASSATQTIPHYIFDVDLDYAGHRLSAVEQIMIPNTFGFPLSELVFNVPPAHGIGTFYMQDVRVGHDPAEFELTGTVLTVTLPSELMPADTMMVTFDFVLYVEPLGDNVASFAAANLAYTDDLLTVGYWYPMLAPFAPGRGWVTVPWYPIGDPFASESADYTATITATPGVTIVAGGDMTRNNLARGCVARQDNVWHFELPRGRTFAFIASSEYSQADMSVDGVTYSVYTLAQHERLAPIVMQTAVRAAQLYATLYGPYPYSSLRVAEVSGPWSMEFSGLVALGYDDIADYNGTQRNRLVRIAAHEVSHQWWYGVVGNDQAREPWLDEALARFSELRYYEFYSPQDAWWWRAATAVSSSFGAVDSSIYDFHFHNSYIEAVYNRGAMFFDTLRLQIGEVAFDEMMRRYYQNNRFRLITAQDLFNVLNEHPEAQWVMQQYLKNPPALSNTIPGLAAPAFKHPAQKKFIPQ